MSLKKKKKKITCWIIFGLIWDPAPHRAAQRLFSPTPSDILQSFYSTEYFFFFLTRELSSSFFLYIFGFAFDFPLLSFGWDPGSALYKRCIAIQHGWGSFILIFSIFHISYIYLSIMTYPIFSIPLLTWFFLTPQCHSYDNNGAFHGVGYQDLDFFSFFLLAVGWIIAIYQN